MSLVSVRSFKSMVEVSKPDYLSLVNKGGSGFNVSEIVTSLVAAEIALI